ncbi:hypothetical protein [Rhizobacter sp. SG703]|uniref:hypothetical protein n=1 Tax=Rhizobacter sp. SG703 TaxID=2587140 RepID=UPI0014470FB1|nr:hypothetical protein [Rhizobacter sp. SG703]NKI97675.1 hypothetical protein [Rhizobacter sp. SG703]
MKRALVATLWAVSVAMTGTSALAGPTVYRCGPDRNVYSQLPCTDGEAVDARDGRTAKQRADAEAAAHRQAEVGSKMEQDRLAREAAIRPSSAMNLAPVAHAASAPKASPAKGKTKKAKGHKATDDDLRIIVPAAKGKPAK